MRCLMPLANQYRNPGMGLASPLDALAASLYVAYGQCRLVSTWTGPLVTVRRSTDNATMDVYAAYSAGEGWIDTVALLAWCGSASAYVTRWWDQSGLGRHAEQTTAAAQPMLVNAGVLVTLNGRPSLRLNGSSYFTFGTSSSTAAGMLAVIAVLYADSYAIGRNQTVFSNQPTSTACWIHPTTYNFTANVIGSASETLVNGKKYLLAAVFNGAGSFMAVNSSITTKNFDTSPIYLTGSTNLLTGSNVANTIIGNVSEVIILSTISTNQYSSLYAGEANTWGLT